MKLKLLLTSACIASSASPLAIAANDILPAKFSADFKLKGPSNRPAKAFVQTFVVTQPLTVRNNTILSVFEPASIPPGESVLMHISSDQRGMPVITPLNAASWKNTMPCEQVVWDAWPLLNPQLRNTRGDCKFAGSNGKFLCAKLLVANGNSSFVIHIIPPSFFLLYPGTFEQAELHDRSNLKVLWLTPSKVALLRNYRIDWINFAKMKERTRQEILERADELTRKYSSLFEKETGPVLRH